MICPLSFAAELFNIHNFIGLSEIQGAAMKSIPVSWSRR